MSPTVISVVSAPGRRWRPAFAIAALAVLAQAVTVTPASAAPAPPATSIPATGKPVIAAATATLNTPARHARYAPLLADPAAVKAARQQHASDAHGGAAKGPTPAVPADRLDQAATAAPTPAPRAPFQPKTAVYGVATGLTAADEAGSDSPSDSTGAIGPRHYVEMVNHLVRVYGRNLSPAGAALPLEAFAGLPVTDCAVDPQVQWDNVGQVWLYALLALPCAGPTSSYLSVGWSKSSDPSDLVAGWCHFNVNPDQPAGPFAPSANVFDYPKLGHSDAWIVVGTNAFNSSQAFLGANVLALQRPAQPPATCAAPGPSSRDFSGGSLNGMFTPVGANVMTHSSTAFLVATPPPPSATSTAVYTLALAADGSSLTTATKVVAAYGVPANAPQTGGQPFDTMDSRLTQAVATVDPTPPGMPAGLTIWTQHTIYDPSVPAGAVVRWYELAAVPGMLGYPLQSGTVWGGPNSYLFNAAIAPTMTGNEAVIHYNAVFPLANGGVSRVLSRSASRFSFTPSGVMTNYTVLGQSSDIAADRSCQTGTCRWGDYAGASPDPVNAHVVWGTSAVNGNRPIGCSVTTAECASWVTGNFQLATFFPTNGYNILTSFGGIYSFGSAHYYGNLIDHGYPGPAIGLGEMPLGDGYQILTTFGGIYSFGSASGHYYGNLIDHGYPGPAVALALTPSGNGYAILTASGGIYTFGDAGYFGNLIDHGYPGPAVSMSYTPDGLGYSILTQFGGIYSFGDARYYGNLVDHGYPGPASSLAFTGSGAGYSLLTSSGGIYSFGDAQYFGNLIDHGLTGPAVALSNTP